MYFKIGITLADFDAMCAEPQAYDAFINCVRGLEGDGFIVVSDAQVMSASTVLRNYVKTAFVADSYTVSFARLKRLCKVIYRYDNGGLTLVYTGAQVEKSVSAARVGLFVSNGFGLGHVARMQALAGMLHGHVPYAFFSMSAGLVDEAYYAPSAQYLGLTDAGLARRYMHEAVLRFCNHFAPTHIIYDGNVLPDGLLSVLALRPDIHLTWVRRGMWPEATGAQYMATQALCDVVLQPGDLAGDADTGPSWHDRLAYCPANHFIKAAPIMRGGVTPLTRNDARAKLGLAAGARYALIMLGAVQKVEDADVLAQVLQALKGRYVPVVAHWPMACAPAPDIDACVIEQMPLRPYYGAFDVVLSAAGYNSFHELLCADNRIVFIPQEDAGRDQQLARAQYAKAHNWAALCRRDGLDTLPHVLDTLVAQTRPEFDCFNEGNAFLQLLGITGGGAHGVPLLPVSLRHVGRNLKALHKRLKGGRSTRRFVVARDARILKKCDPVRDIIITNTISPVLLRRAGFKYLWVNGGSDFALRRQLKNWLDIWQPQHVLLRANFTLFNCSSGASFRMPTRSGARSRSCWRII